MKKYLLIIAMLSLAAVPALLPADGSDAPGDALPDGMNENDQVEDDDEGLFPAPTLKAARQGLVIVRTWFKKDVSESPSEVNNNYRLREMYDQYIEKKRPRESAGVVVAGNRVLVYDDGIESRFIDRVEIETIDGEKLPARRARLLANVTAIELEVADKHRNKLTPLDFVKLDKGIQTPLKQASLQQEEDQWRIRLTSLPPAVQYARGEIDNVYYGYRGGYGYGRWHGFNTTNPSVICRKDGKPVGCSLGRFFDIKETEVLWLGSSLKRAEGVSIDTLATKEQTIRKKLDAAVYEMIIKYRGDGGSSRYSYNSSTAGQEVPVFAVAITDRHILIPMPLDRKTADKIDKIYIKHSATKRERVEFVGAYKGFTGYVVKARKGKLPAHIQLAKRDQPAMEPFWTGTLKRKFGRKYLELSTNRLIGKSRGYEGKYHWDPVRRINHGELLMNFDGELIGLYLRKRIENEEAKELERSDRYYYSDSPTDPRVFTVSQLRPALTSPEKFMDPKIKIRPRTLAKRRAWFGVEYVKMSKDLAEQWNVEKPTKDGQVGYVVNVVYPDSPAARLGIRPGDILLRAQSPGMPYPFEFPAESADSSGGYYGGGFYDPSEAAMGPAAGIWASRQSMLTRAMDAIGVGKTVTLWVHDRNGKDKGTTRKISYKIELAPPDQDSAQKWQNRKLGITVRNLTYEVRHALNRTADEPGVLVAKVESGSPTLVARIFPNEIIVRLGETPVTSAKHLRDLIAAANKNGLDKVRLTILRLGKTRFADLQIDEYDPADDEGLEEDDE
jgi:hypothetical protein